ncbi:non-canonical purine NTP pyrophosphatase, RdgB/HAM1 family [Candidatus Beckwithbacteria bacterium CG10_big_fil_rev_8_21_14_0_10_34_10]|uniref:dITP/XTP pyrophosphatase n=1 Tax=Candidatus Beckwithbacteria bacterium CG10_big_fil_rev_8_21_14_0_10_34_10 TaxID=1974495 RepID=A0A2H0W8F1_9BACT|nr:MAG: non-canonical purine NTP pyrophosphatase, RdgB/HAM1 family [Candidatus Beckwithbacteria bacterium CG10_big_fil_rev_8_21_14_0_10_34_10]
MLTLLLATNQPGKLKEFKDILKTFKLKMVFLNNLNKKFKEPQENGKTLSKNAFIKAQYYGEKTKLLTLADDTGLFVKTLPNKLGIKTKRYHSGSDKDRRQKLLKELKNIPFPKRQAVFKTAVCLYNPKTKKSITRIGTCPGKISLKEIGGQGFGYDSIFIVKEKNKTFSELSLKEKNKLSHRAKALKKLKPHLKKYEKS